MPEGTANKLKPISEKNIAAYGLPPLSWERALERIQEEWKLQAPPYCHSLMERAVQRARRNRGRIKTERVPKHPKKEENHVRTEEAEGHNSI